MEVGKNHAVCQKIAGHRKTLGKPQSLG